MDHRFADAIRPDELDIVLTIRDDLAVQIPVHILVVECVDVARTHRAVKVTFRRALERDLDGTTAQHGLVTEITCRDTEAIPEFSATGHSFQPSQMKPRV